jgi:hypothetical protein
MINSTWRVSSGCLARSKPLVCKYGANNSAGR